MSAIEQSQFVLIQRCHNSASVLTLELLTMITDERSNSALGLYVLGRRCQNLAKFLTLELQQSLMNAMILFWASSY